MISEDVLQYLKDNKYIVSINNELTVSNKFFRDIGARIPKSASTNAMDVDNQPSPTTGSVGNSLAIPLSNSKEAYKQFIVDAEIPRYISNGFGSRFSANNYSIDGHKSWKKALEEYDYKVLLAATKYYYKQQNTARKMVGNFFSEGIYESFVDEVKNAIAGRKVLPDSEDSSSNMEQG